MPTAAQRLFDTQAACFTRDRIDWMTAQYALPLAVFRGDEITVFRSREQLAQTIGYLRRQAFEAGTQRLEAQVKAVGMPRNGRSPVWVDWVHRDGAEQEIMRSRACYFCRWEDGRPAIEMVEYHDFALPEAMRKLKVG